jgi:hypothetical protein
MKVEKVLFQNKAGLSIDLKHRPSTLRAICLCEDS